MFFHHRYLCKTRIVGDSICRQLLLTLDRVGTVSLSTQQHRDGMADNEPCIDSAGKEGIVCVLKRLFQNSI